MLCRAMAKQASATLLHISASNIHEMWFGNSERNVAAVFSLAKKLSPAISTQNEFFLLFQEIFQIFPFDLFNVLTIDLLLLLFISLVFVDEADSILGTREAGRGSTPDIPVKTEFMAQWDGMLNHNENRSVVIICATNRPYALDPAVLRRLPHRILVDLPDVTARKSILNKLLKDVHVDLKSLPAPSQTADLSTPESQREEFITKLATLASSTAQTPPLCPSIPLVSLTVGACRLQRLGSIQCMLVGGSVNSDGHYQRQDL